MEHACCSSATFTRSEDRPLLIRLAYSPEPIEHGVLQFVALLLLAVPPALVVAGVAGYRMAHKALQPLDKNGATR